MNKNGINRGNQFTFQPSWLGAYAGGNSGAGSRASGLGADMTDAGLSSGCLTHSAHMGKTSMELVRAHSLTAYKTTLWSFTGSQTPSQGVCLFAQPNAPLKRGAAVRAVN